MTYKIAHITDLHIGYEEPEPNYINFKRLLKSIEAHKCDHIMITGDIGDFADMRDYKIIRNVLEEAELLNSERLSVIPGNHDIFGGPNKELPSFMYPTHCKNTDHRKKVFQFYHAFKETFESAYIDREEIFPFVKLLNDKIALIGINSNAEWSLKKNPEGTNGAVTDELLRKLKLIFKLPAVKDKLKLVMIHHYFNAPNHNKSEPEHALWLTMEENRMKMFGKKKLSELFKAEGIAAVYHGHTHITETYYKNKCTYVNSSGCSKPFTKAGYREYYISSINLEKDSPFIDLIEKIKI